MWQIAVIKKDGKRTNYDLTPSAKCAFEDHFQTGFLKRLRDEQRESDLWWLAFFLAKKKGEASGEIEAWIDQFDDVDLVTDAPNGSSAGQNSTN
jgi:hypothetical protein